MAATPLSIALMTQQSYNVIELLLSNGANINEDPVIWKTSYISRIIWSGNTSLLELLLSYGMDPNKSDTYGHKPLQLAECRNDVDIGTLLRRYGAYTDKGEI